MSYRAPAFAEALPELAAPGSTPERLAHSRIAFPNTAWRQWVETWLQSDRVDGPVNGAMAGSTGEVTDARGLSGVFGTGVFRGDRGV